MSKKKTFKELSQAQSLMHDAVVEIAQTLGLNPEEAIHGALLAATQIALAHSTTETNLIKATKAIVKMAEEQHAFAIQYCAHKN